MGIAESKTNRVYLKVFITIILTNIVISKIFGILSSISMGAALSLLLILILVPYGFHVSRRTGKFVKLLFIASLITLLFCFFKIFLGGFDYQAKVNAFVKIGMVPFIYFAVLNLNLSKSDINDIVGYFLKISLLFSVLGIFQFFYHEQLPQFLIEFSLKSLRSDTMYIGDTIIYRSNGLIGNPLEYSFFLLIVQCLSLARYYSKKEYTYLVVYLVSFIACMTTLSKFAIAASVLSLIILSFIYNSKRNLLIIALLILLVTPWISKNYESILLLNAASERMSFIIGEKDGQKDARYDYAQYALEDMSKYPEALIGYDLGSITSNTGTAEKRIYDGFWIGLLVEQGIPFFIFYCFFWIIQLALSIYLYVNNKNYLVICSMLLTIFLIIGGIVNSAYFNIAVCVLFYLINGLSMKTYKNEFIAA